ncbi:MAG: amidohydrolase family protein, partial [Pseudomonadales bacterium]|nr:amidohydrolase family protein [Pseudomonadales bacterium]
MTISKLRVLRAARIHTMDPGRPTADAVAIADGKIVSVGSIESMQPWLRRIPHEIDDTFADKVLLPGFIDPHTHLRLSGTFMGLNYVGPIASTDTTGHPVSPLRDRDAVIERLKALVAGRNESGQQDKPDPILAWGYDPGMQEGHLDRGMLDAISTEIPIWVMCYAPHIIYTNTPMLALTGVTDESRVHGLGRYPDGRLNGWFIETEATAVATRPVRQHVYAHNFGLAALKTQGQVAVNSGITTSADMIYGVESFDREWADHETAMAAGDLPLRMFLVPFEPTLRKRFGDDFLNFYRDMAEKATDRLAVHGVKFINDGSYPSMTLRLNFPGYLDGEEGLTGEIPWKDMVERMRPFWENGIQIHSHANGD